MCSTYVPCQLALGLCANIHSKSVDTLSFSNEVTTFGHVKFLSWGCCLTLRHWSHLKDVGLSKSSLDGFDLSNIACALTHKINEGNAHVTLFDSSQLWLKDSLLEYSFNMRAELAHLAMMSVAFLDRLKFLRSFQMLEEVSLWQVEYLGSLDHTSCLV